MPIKTDMTRRIYTMDGGHDYLAPSRWKAFVNPFILNENIEGLGLTEDGAVKDLRKKLARKLPNIPWLGDLPYVQVFPVDKREEQ